MIAGARAERFSGRASPGPQEKTSAGTSGPAAAKSLAERAAAARAQANAARAVEKGMNESALVLGGGAIVAGLAGGPLGPGAAAVLGGASLAATKGALDAGEQADKLDQQADSLEKAAAVEKARAEEAAKAKGRTPQSTPKQGESGRDRGSAGRGDTYGGRASAHDPGRADQISRMC